LAWDIVRPKEIHLTGFDLDGNEISIEADEYEARVYQHEVDHLDGILYPMRMTDLSQFGFNEELFPGQALQDD
jgi:peptide deformylase